MVSTAAIEVKDGHFGYVKNNRHISVLQHANLQLQAGDMAGIIGINGSGKSTLLRSLCGLQPVLSGEVFLSGSSVSEIPNSELAKKISIVLTEKIGGFNLTCADAVAAGQLPYTNLFNVLLPEQKKIIEEALSICRLQEHRDKLLTELSDGLFQKTMIAKCIAQQTGVMLLDEPSAYLDYASKHGLFLLLKNLAQEQGKCILISSHDLELVLKYCNKVILVKNSAVEMVPASGAKSHTTFRELSGGFL